MSHRAMSMAETAPAIAPPVKWFARSMTFQWCSIGRGSLPTKYSAYFVIDAALASSWPQAPDSPIPVIPASVSIRTRQKRSTRRGVTLVIFIGLVLSFRRCGTGRAHPRSERRQYRVRSVRGACRRGSGARAPVFLRGDGRDLHRSLPVTAYRLDREVGLLLSLTACLLSEFGL